jgi:hypothetical protein
MGRARRIALACAATALASSGVAVAAALSTHGWRPSALVRMSATEPMARLAREADAAFAFVHPEAHYDGVYFYAVARDPLARGEAHRLIDRAAYRYAHAGYGWLAWAASLGRASAVPGAMLALALAGTALAGYAASRLAAAFGWTPWAGLVVAASPGIVFSVTAATSEPVAAALGALGLLAWARGRLVAAGVALAAGCLVKEPLLLLPAGLAGLELLRWVRGRPAPDLPARLAALAAGPLALGAWTLYLTAAFGRFPLAEPSGELLTAPLAGWWDALRRAAREASGPYFAMQSGSAAVALIAVVGIALLAGLVRAARLRTPLDAVYLPLALLILSLTWLGVQYPKDLLRETALPLALLPAVLAGPRAGPGSPRAP